jgi:hypothetical protein
MSRLGLCQTLTCGIVYRGKNRLSYGAAHPEEKQKKKERAHDISDMNLMMASAILLSDFGAEICGAKNMNMTHFAHIQLLYLRG